MNRNTKYLSVLGAAVLLLLGLVFAQYRFVHLEKPEDVLQQVQDRLKQVEKSFYLLTNSKDSTIVRLLENRQLQEDLDKIEELPFELLLFERENLVFWSSNEQTLLPYAPNTIPPKKSFRKLRNGYYMVVNQPIHMTSSIYEKPTFVALYRLQSDYGSSENRYLKNECVPELGISSNFRFDTEFHEGAVALKNSAGDGELFLYRNSYSPTQGFNQLQQYLQLLTSVLILLMLFGIAIVMAQAGRATWGLIFLVSALLGFRAIIHYLGFPLDTTNFSIFDGEGAYATSFGSIGDLLLNIIALLGGTVYVYYFIPFRYGEEDRKSWMPSFHFGLLLVILLAAVYTSVLILRDVLLTTGANFRLADFLNFNSGTFSVVLSIVLVFIALFYLSIKLLPAAEDLQLSLRQRLQVAIPVLIAFLFVQVFFTINGSTLLICLVILGFACAVPFLNEITNKIWNFRGFVFWVFFFSSFTTFLVNSMSFEKEREIRVELANELSRVDNKNLEEEFDDIAILDDPIIKMAFHNPMIPLSSIIKRLKTKYFSNYFSQFNIDINFYYRNDTPLQVNNRQTLADVRERIDQHGVDTKNDYLWKIANPAGPYSYLARLPIFADREDGSLAGILGFVVLEFHESDPNKSNVYPELVVEDKYRAFEAADSYDFAVYNEIGALESHGGSFAYPAFLPNKFKISEQKRFLSIERMNHYIENLGNGSTIVISKKNKSLLEMLSLFSYVFFFLSVLVFFYIVLKSLLSSEGRHTLMYELFYSSLKRRINSTILGIIFTSFFAIGLITILFFTFRFRENLQRDLLQKQKEIRASLEFEFSQFEQTENWPNQYAMNALVGDVSEIHSMSVNLFDLNGKLLGTSLPVVFESGILSSQMNAAAFHKFNKEYERGFIQSESIGGLNFLSSYIVIHDKKGDDIAYLNLPYYSRDKNLRTEISSFLVALVNVYVLILLLASGLAFLLSNSVTKSLQTIGDKLKELRLGKRNEKLDWPDDDEIGGLVKQYNRTIEELDRSAQMLAKSERQYAWQQMAKQIAHEIKNPLTPMKLSIQHLQRAQAENHPDVKNLTKRVSKTLIEQIDHLAHIATEFSTFAKVPQAITEVVDLGESLTGIINLYRDSRKIKIIKVFPEEDSTIIADKIQLNRVFHNLVKNAVQATEDEEQAVLIISIKPKNGKYLLSFADNGKGIPLSAQEKVFTPNFTTKNSGMGLGLAISQNIIENMDGKIWFESVVGEGTTFFVELPQNRL